MSYYYWWVLFKFNDCEVFFVGVKHLISLIGRVEDNEVTPGRIFYMLSLYD